MEDAAGLAVAKQFQSLAQALNEAARGHQTVALSGVADAHASIPKWLAQAEVVQAGGATAAQSGAPVVNLSARAGVAVTAARDVAMTAGENAHLSSSAALDVAAGGAARVHAGQAIGVLGGAMQPGGEAAGTGLTLIAGAGDMDLQAQDGPMQIAALRDVTFQTVNGAIDWAAAKRIVISTAGGAGLILEGGNVEFVAPGTLTMRAGKRSFIEPSRHQYSMPVLPQQICVQCLFKARASGAPFVLR